MLFPSFVVFVVHSASSLSLRVSYIEREFFKVTLCRNIHTESTFFNSQTLLWVHILFEIKLILATLPYITVFDLKLSFTMHTTPSYVWGTWSAPLCKHNFSCGSSHRFVVDNFLTFCLLTLEGECGKYTNPAWTERRLNRTVCQSNKHSAPTRKSAGVRQRVRKQRYSPRNRDSHVRDGSQSRSHGCLTDGFDWRRIISLLCLITWLLRQWEAISKNKVCRRWDGDREKTPYKAALACGVRHPEN